MKDISHCIGRHFSRVLDLVSLMSLFRHFVRFKARIIMMLCCVNIKSPFTNFAVANTTPKMLLIINFLEVLLLDQVWCFRKDSYSESDLTVTQLFFQLRILLLLLISQVISMTTKNISGL